MIRTGVKGYVRSNLSVCAVAQTLLIVLSLLLLRPIPALSARDKDTLQYGEGLIINIPLPVDEVAQAVGEVAGNGIIRGTKEYAKDEYVTGAEAPASTPVFSAWKDPGKVFYKVKKSALDPWNFKDTSDLGTLAVRYVVQPQGDKNTVLRIDALFVEDNRHAIHESNGSVEGSEYKDIRDHLDQVELMKKETVEALAAKQEHITEQHFDLSGNTELLSTPTPDSLESSNSSSNPNSKDSFSRGDEPDGASSLPARRPAAGNPDETPEQHLASLRRQVERVVKKPGAPLKSAPFHTASTLKSLDPGAEVLIVVVTPYWFGVETHDGQHGWIARDQLELLP